MVPDNTLENHHRPVFSMLNVLKNLLCGNPPADNVALITFWPDGDIQTAADRWQ
jgi:hypothetical protein